MQPVLSEQDDFNGERAERFREDLIREELKGVHHLISQNTRKQENLTKPVTIYGTNAEIITAYQGIVVH